MKPILLWILTVTALASPLDLDKIDPVGLNRDQAKKVLLIVLEHEKIRHDRPGLIVKADIPPPHPGYYDFSVGRVEAKTGAIRPLGRYAVSRQTGDAWEIGRCRRYDFPALDAAQRKIMARTGKGFDEERAERLRLGCGDEGNGEPAGERLDAPKTTIP